MKNHADALIISQCKRRLQWLFVSERKQIALIRHKKSLSRISCAVLRDKSLRNGDFYV